MILFEWRLGSYKPCTLTIPLLTRSPGLLQGEQAHIFHNARAGTWLEWQNRKPPGWKSWCPSSFQALNWEMDVSRTLGCSLRWPVAPEAEDEPIFGGGGYLGFLSSTSWFCPEAGGSLSSCLETSLPPPHTHLSVPGVQGRTPRGT